MLYTRLPAMNVFRMNLCLNYMYVIKTRKNKDYIEKLVPLFNPSNCTSECSTLYQVIHHSSCFHSEMQIMFRVRVRPG